MTTNRIGRGMAFGVAIVAIAGLTGVTSANATTAAPPPSALVWGECPADESVPAGVGCATLSAPLDYAEPDGQQITLTISGIGSLDAPHFMLVNPGGPGAIGLGTEQLVYSHLPADVTGQYAVFSFDPRGTGASTPISCGDTSKLTPHPALPYLPANSQQEQQRVSAAKQVASQCGANAKSMLPYLTVDNEARDMDRIRVALGRDKIDYLGYSAGTRLGATYATLFPTHAGRMILDSVVDPTVSTYQTGYEQDLALRNRATQLFAWAATKDATYHLGPTEQAVASAWQATRTALAAKPAGGPVSPNWTTCWPRPCTRTTPGPRRRRRSVTTARAGRTRCSASPTNWLRAASTRDSWPTTALTPVGRPTGRPGTPTPRRRPARHRCSPG